MNLYGEIMALLTAGCWTFNSVVFTWAGKRVGAFTVNAMRLWIAIPALVLLHGLLFGTPFPFAVEPWRLLCLGVSGVIGFIAGDTMLFASFLLIGPRLAMLLSLLVPVFSAALSWVFLGEKLLALEILGILVTIGGVAWVVAEKPDPLGAHASVPARKFSLGIWLAAGGAAGQALGLLFSKIGLAGGYSAVSATHVRVTVAGMVLVLLGLLQGKPLAHLARMKDWKALLQITAGALTGPALGVILSLVAIAHASIGVASTLMSLTPVLLLPVSHFLFKERITCRAVTGTLVALAGVVLLFLT